MHPGRFLAQLADGGDTAHFGHLQIHQYHIGAGGNGARHRLRAGGGFGDDLERWFCRQHRHHALAEQRMVVGDNNAQSCIHYPRPSGGRGIVTTMRVPPQSTAPRVRTPPSSSVRSRIDWNPTPGRYPSGMPLPSSTISSRTSLSISSVIRTTRAAACRLIFVNASSTIRYTATSIAAGRPVSSPDARSSIAIAGEPRSNASNRPRSAVISPNSSSAGGRNPWTSLRISVMAERSSVLSLIHI